MNGTVEIVSQVTVMVKHCYRETAVMHPRDRRFVDRSRVAVRRAMCLSGFVMSYLQAST